MIAIDMKISRRRVEQIWKQYKETGVEPKIGTSSLNFNRLESPEIAFLRKIRPEAVFSIDHRLFKL